MSNIKLSNSAINTYTDCGYKYKLNYVDRIRINYLKSSFIFGGAVDAAMEAILLNKKDKLNEDPYLVFLDKMFESELNGEKINLSNSSRCRYSKVDVQLELLDETDLSRLKERMDELGFDTADYSVEDFWNYYDESTKKKLALTDKDYLMFSYIAFLSLLQKGRLIIKELQKWSDKNVKEVVSTQKYVEVENEAGDILRGYLDFVVVLNNGKTTLLDLKTSSDPKRDYPDGCVQTSQQLAIYYDQINVDQAGYLVAGKKLKKKDPKVQIREVYGDISEDDLNVVFDKIDVVLSDIKEEKFEKNDKSCFNYGGCEYFSLCKKGSMKGLIKL